jgi:hypothetical protein
MAEKSLAREHYVYVIYRLDGRPCYVGMGKKMCAPPHNAVDH